MVFCSDGHRFCGRAESGELTMKSLVKSLVERHASSQKAWNTKAAKVEVVAMKNYRDCILDGDVTVKELQVTPICVISASADEPSQPPNANPLRCTHPRDSTVCRNSSNP